MTDDTEKPTLYRGSCHCQAVRFEATFSLAGAMACNCSICSRTGWLLAFVPAEAVTITTGQDALTSYQFGNKHIDHTFCSTCGVRPFSSGNNPDGGVTFSVNLRCIEGLDLSEVPTQHYDGASL